MTDSSETKIGAPVEINPLQSAGCPETTATVVFTNLFRKGFERFAEFHKYALDLYADQTADVISAWKKFIPVAPMPGEALFYDFARQGVGYLVELQKGMVDVAVRQSMIGIGAMREIRTSVSQAAEKGYEPMIDAMDVLISNQENIIGIASSTVERIGELVSDAAEYGVRRDSDNAAVQQEEVRVNVQPQVTTSVISASADAGVSPAPSRRPNHARRANGAKQKKG
jgi:hypothetical protein